MSGGGRSYGPLGKEFSKGLFGGKAGGPFGGQFFGKQGVGGAGVQEVRLVFRLTGNRS